MIDETKVFAIEEKCCKTFMKHFYRRSELREFRSPESGQIIVHKQSLMVSKIFYKYLEG